MHSWFSASHFIWGTWWPGQVWTSVGLVHLSLLMMCLQKEDFWSVWKQIIDTTVRASTGNTLQSLSSEYYCCSTIIFTFNSVLTPYINTWSLHCKVFLSSVCKLILVFLTVCFIIKTFLIIVTLILFILTTACLMHMDSNSIVLTQMPLRSMASASLFHVRW